MMQILLHLQRKFIHNEQFLSNIRYIISHFQLHGAGTWFTVQPVRTCSRRLVYVDPRKLTARDHAI